MTVSKLIKFMLHDMYRQTEKVATMPFGSAIVHTLGVPASLSYTSSNNMGLVHTWWFHSWPARLPGNVCDCSSWIRTSWCSNRATSFGSEDKKINAVILLPPLNIFFCCCHKQGTIHKLCKGKPLWKLYPKLNRTLW